MYMIIDRIGISPEEKTRMKQVTSTGKTVGLFINSAPNGGCLFYLLR